MRFEPRINLRSPETYAFGLCRSLNNIFFKNNFIVTIVIKLYDVNKIQDYLYKHEKKKIVYQSCKFLRIK